MWYYNLINKIGKEAVLSRCCNNLALIILMQSELGKITCMNRSCIDPVLGYFKLNSVLVNYLFNEAERMISYTSIRRKALNPNIKKNIAKSIKIRKRNVLVLSLKKKNIQELLGTMSRLPCHIKT